MPTLQTIAAPSAPAAAPSRRSRLVAAARRCFLSDYLVFGLTGLLLAVLGPFTPGLLTLDNLPSIFAYMLPLFVVAMGATLVMITGGIDLSCTSAIALASISGALLMTKGPLAGSAFAPFAGAAAMLAIGGAVGAINGAIVSVLRLPPFIVTLAAMMFWSGFAIWLTESHNISGLPVGFNAVGQNLAIASAITFGLAFLLHQVLGRTAYGRWLYATGMNPVAAHISGVPVRGTLFMVYVASGLLAAVASVLFTGRLETGSPVMGREILLDIIGATVVGGTSLFGGRGKIAWTFAGVLFLSLLGNALNLLNLSHFTITIVKGAVILIASILDAIRRRLALSAA